LAISPERPSSENLVTLRDTVDYVLLSLLWGASFLFMRIAAPEFGPFPLMGLRCLIGAVTLLGLLWWYGQLNRLTEKQATGMIIGVLNSAIPFVLLGFAALSMASGSLSIINASAPFWSALIGWLWLKDALTRWQMVGLLLGFLGVVVLMLTQSSSAAVGGLHEVLVVGAGLLATAFYGLSANAAKRYLQNTQPLVNAANSQIGATLVLIVPTILLWPSQPIGSTVWIAVVCLGVFSTGIAYLLYFRLIGRIGAAKAVTVVFVIPLVAVLLGWLVLAETVYFSTIVAGVIIIGGSTLSLQLLPRKTSS
jgi:drug/metabolite transporter (DMT)-like permease